MSDTWWTDCVGYQVYVPSFCDSNGDGWGDLTGVTSRLDHLQGLGVDLLWLSPIHPSPFADHGYDVADYTGVDPRFGTMRDLDLLLDAAHRRGMRVLLDLVPNHTSDRHPWFEASSSSREDPHRDWYIWRDPGPDGGPPNNWPSRFGGSAWTFDARTGQYYLHLFAREQPDLNWRNDCVVRAFQQVMSGWLDRGVDGFRVDVPHLMLKHPDLPDLPMLPPDRVEADSRGAEQWSAYDHRHDLDQPDVVALHARLADVTRPRGAVLVGEVNLPDPTRLARYTTGGGLDLVFWFGLKRHGWDPDLITRRLVRPAAEQVPGLVWVLASHDRPRAVSRYGGGAPGRRRALTLATLTFGLPALPLLYMGEELGLPDVEVAEDDVQDPLVLRGGAQYPRDRVRSPMPWEPGPGLGFTTADRAWMPFGRRVPADTVAVQAADPASPLAAYRELVAVRRRTPSLRSGGVTWLDAGERVLAYRRGEGADAVVVAANLDDEPRTLALPTAAWRPAFSTHAFSAARAPRLDAGGLTLDAEQAVVLRPD